MCENVPKNFTRDGVVVNQGGVSPSFFASIGSHIPLIGDDPIASKSTCASACDVALGQYCSTCSTSNCL